MPIFTTVHSNGVSRVSKDSDTVSVTVSGIADCDKTEQKPAQILYHTKEHLA